MRFKSLNPLNSRLYLKLILIGVILLFLLTLTSAKKVSKKGSSSSSGKSSSSGRSNSNNSKSSSSSTNSQNKQRPVYSKSIPGKGSSVKSHGSVSVIGGEGVDDVHTNSQNQKYTKINRKKGSGSKNSGTSGKGHASVIAVSLDGSENKMKESYVLPTLGDPGIKQSSWVGILGIDKNQVEQGGLYADGVDLNLEKVFVEPSKNKVTTTASTTIEKSVEHGMFFGQNQYQSSAPPSSLNNFELLDKKINDVQKMLETVTKNIEVMQQNTQVISKGFNILSSRVNKVSADHEQIHSHFGQIFKGFEDQVVEVQKNMTKAMMEIEIKNKQELENLKKTDQDLLESQVTSGQERQISMENLSKEMSNMHNETKILAEMVKALAEIQKTEKIKLENLTEYSHLEIQKLDENFKKLQVEDANNREAFATKIRILRTEVQEVNETLTTTSESLKSSLSSVSSHVEEQIKRVDEAILEQNMAHNMAHENIMLKFEELEEKRNTKEGKGKSIETESLEDIQINQKISNEDFQKMIERLDDLETNMTTIFDANRQFLDQVTALEDTDMTILSKIADIRNIHKSDNFTLRNDILTTDQRVGDVESECKMISLKVNEIERRLEKDKSIEIGGLSMSDPTSPTISTSEGTQPEFELSEVRDRFGTIEENVAELWRSQKDLKSQHESFSSLLKDLQKGHQKDLEDSSLQIMEVKIATKMLTEVVRNSTRNLFEMEKRIDHGSTHVGSSARASGPNKNEIESLKDEMRTAQENIANLWDSNHNISKAQEFFLFKLLEMDLEHKQDNKTITKRLMTISNRTEDFIMQVSRSEERLNKVVQQFEITDAEQNKMREELFNIKDRLATSEENYGNLWKTNKKLIANLDEVSNNVDNIIIIHKTEHRNISGELKENKAQVANLTKNIQNLDDKVSNIELVLDMQEISSGESNTSELGRLKSRLMSSEKDISELWKSTEILSFQQQVFTENFKALQADHENETSLSRLERMKTKFETMNLFELYANLSVRVNAVEKCTNPPYDSKTVELEINNWRAAVAGGLKDQFVIYELGEHLDLPSSWKAFVELNGNQLSIFNTLLAADQPTFNEFEAEILDSDGKAFASFGPDLHLYRANNEKIGWTNVISLQSLENSRNNLINKNSLRLRFKVKVYPKVEKEEEETEGPSEKQLVVWDVKDLLPKLHNQSISDYQAFLDLNVTKEFAAGHSWGGHSLWRSSLLVREINNQNYLGINMELVKNDGKWKELTASYNVTLLDAHSRIAKEFSIASNDFKTVSARHSYFMLVKDVEEVLKRGDHITVRIYFDLKAIRNSFDVEVIR